MMWHDMRGWVGRDNGVFGIWYWTASYVRGIAMGML